MTALPLNAGLFFEDFQTGQKVKSAGRTITEHDIATFAGLSGDFNQIHTDAEFAKSTPFGQRIAHGLMALSFTLLALTGWPLSSHGVGASHFLVGVFGGLQSAGWLSRPASWVQTSSPSAKWVSGNLSNRSLSAIPSTLIWKSWKPRPSLAWEADW